jgi:hypothetical protein
MLDIYNNDNYKRKKIKFDEKYQIEFLATNFVSDNCFQQSNGNDFQMIAF